MLRVLSAHTTLLALTHTLKPFTDRAPPWQARPCRRSENSLGAPSCFHPNGQSVLGMADWLPSCFGRAGGARWFRCSTFACSLLWSSPAPHRSPHQSRNRSRPSLPFRLAAGARFVQRKGSSRNACAGGCLQWLSIVSLCCCDASRSVVLSERAVRRLQTGRQSCAKLILFRPQLRSLAEAVALAGEGLQCVHRNVRRRLLGGEDGVRLGHAVVGAAQGT